ncbi:MAG: hypothetical protein H0W72_08540 [Planctomycetes bacterium]|nr:hypothetical protein [Planctomycetota bacterium]
MASTAWDADADRERRGLRRAAFRLRDLWLMTAFGTGLSILAGWQHVTLRHDLPALPLSPLTVVVVAALGLALLLGSVRSAWVYRHESPPSVRHRARFTQVLSIPGWCGLAGVAWFWGAIGWLWFYHTWLCPCR